MALRYNSPPNWPAPPAGWTPPNDWNPDPSWGPAPPGWRFWIDDATAPGTAEVPAAGPPPAAATNTKKNWFARHKVMTSIGAAVVLIAVIASLTNGSNNAPVAEPPPATSPPAQTPVQSDTSSTAGASPSTRATPRPTKTSEPSEAPPASKPLRYSGRGNKILKIKKPSEGPSLITFTHSGESNFIVSQLDANLKEDENLVNAIGDYKGSTILDLSGEQETKRLKIEADGEWTVRIAELTDAREIKSSDGGRGDDVVIYRGKAGVATLTHKGEDNFIVDFYNDDGSENLVNEIGKYSGEGVIGAGPGFLVVKADGKWTIKID